MSSNIAKWIIILWMLSFSISKINGKQLSSATVMTNIINDNNLSELRNVRPDFDNGPLSIQASIYIMDIGPSPSSAGLQSIDFFADFYFRQKWNDQRLKFEYDGSTNISSNSDTDLDFITLTSNQIDAIWLLDTFIPSAKQLHDQKSFNNGGNRFVKIYSNGDVFYSHRLFTIISCKPENFNHFPLDKPVCRLEFESYGYSTSDIEYDWMTNTSGSIAAKPPSLIDFELVNSESINDNDSYNLNIEKQMIELSSGSYSRLIARIVFKRNCGYYYFVNIYLPTFLLTFISLLSLYLSSSYMIDNNNNNNNNRSNIDTSLLVNLFSLLIMIVMLVFIHKLQSSITVMTIINIYVFASMLLVFLSIILLQINKICNNYYINDNDHNRKQRSSLVIGATYRLDEQKIIQKHSAIRFMTLSLPIIFILFNICYCLTILLFIN